MGTVGIQPYGSLLGTDSCSPKLSQVQGLKSIGNTGTAFPGRQTVGRKEEAIIMRNQEDRRSFTPSKVKKWEN